MKRTFGACRVARVALCCAAAVAILTACGGEETVPIAEATLPNSPPVLSGAPVTTADVGQLYVYQPTATDPDGDQITFTIVNQPQWTTFNSVNGELRGTPSDADAGDTAEIQITATDGRSSSPSITFKITVRPRNQPPPPPQNTPPTISGSPSLSVVTGQAYVFQPTAADANGDALSFTIVNKPVWASFSTTTGRLAGTPAATHAGSYANITIAVSDGRASTALPAFTIQVQAPANRAPTITGTPGTTIASGSAYAFQPTASDPDGNNLTFSIQNKPTWAVFNTSTGRLSGTPASAHVGIHSGIVISVSDGAASASLQAFTITVTNAAPTISGTPSTSVNAETAYSFQPSANDANGDPLTFNIQNKPAWATFDAQTGRLSGTPAAADVGNYANIVISVSDGRASASLAAFTIAVVQDSSGSVTLNWTAPTLNVDGSPLVD
ncbi:MAG: putative Ig domain-containing protein, partial [Steroidobacteraceae bacterium]